MAGLLKLDFTRTFRSGTEVRADLEVDTDRSSVTVIFGPSGAGKSTILRCLAGLDSPTSGQITFGKDVWFNSADQTDVSPRQRRVGYVEQNLSLFPHMTVAQNVAYPMTRCARSERAQRVSELLDMMGIGELAGRRPSQISGGQSQRVAIARAIARNPCLLLMDEAFASLDLPTAQSLRNVLRQVVTDLQIPAIVVTHDRDEALTIADQIAIVAGGRICQTGDVASVFSRPDSLEIAEVVGVETVIAARVIARQEGLVTLAPVESPETCLEAIGGDQESADVFVCIRAEDVTVSPGPDTLSSARNRLRAVITGLAPEGSAVRMHLDCGFPLDAIVTKQSVSDLDLRPGREVTAAVKAPSVHLIPRPAVDLSRSA